MHACSIHAARNNCVHVCMHVCYTACLHSLDNCVHVCYSACLHLLDTVTACVRLLGIDGLSDGPRPYVWFCLLVNIFAGGNSTSRHSSICITGKNTTAASFAHIPLLCVCVCACVRVCVCCVLCVCVCVAPFPGGI